MQITNTNDQFRVANGSDIEFYSFAQIKAVSWRKDSVTSNYILLIYFTANDLDNPAEFDLTKITNQAGWTNNAAGIQQAVADVSGWMSTSGGSGTLTSILASLQAGREFESRLVKDNAGVLWNEIRFMDTDTGAFTIEYHNASGVSGSPSLPVTFVDSTATLASILAKNTEIETTANAIETLNTSILADTATIDTAVNGSRTAGMSRETGSSNVGTLSGATNVYSASFYNAHASVVATVVGASLNPGETVNFDAGGNGCYLTASDLTYNGNSGDLVVAYIK
jgi:hypothetical protein